jgi:Flp pilus assembly protein TadG
MKLRWLRDQRGSILLFTTVLVVPLMLIIGGLALDLSYYGTVDDQLQRSMDAAALAGAGKLGFDDSVFPTVRSFAQNYASINTFKSGTISLDLNTANTPSGNIVLGIWNDATRTFTPSTDGTFVNAVRCRYSSSVPTSFLRLIGLNSLATAAQATAVSVPPATVCPGCCIFPIGVTKCAFQSAGNFGSQGCGQPVSTFTSATVNTAAWINLSGTGTPGAPDTQTAIQNAANGGPCNSTLRAGDPVGASGGMVESVFGGTGPDYPGLADCNGHNCDSGPGTRGYFIDKFNSATTYTVRDSDNNITYEGHGWEVFVPVIDTAAHNCPPGNLNGTLQILTYTRLVITQVIDHGYCAVANHYPGNLWDAHCPTPNGQLAAREDPNLRAIFGYYSCAPIDSVPTPIPAPRAALATRLRLVQ